MRRVHAALALLAILSCPISASGQPAPPVVVIDPGHGGHDSGAIAADGTQEKEVTLVIAQRIAAGLTAAGGVTVRLTRRSDRFVTLDDRIKFARRHRATLFLSVHADSAPSTAASGWTIYGLSDAASSVAAARFARRENAALAGQNAAVDSDIAAILADVIQSATVASAREVSRTLEASLRRGTALHGNGFRQAGFWVLKATEVPSLLLETGYLSNRTDLAYLRSAAGQALIADAVVTAIVARLAGRAHAKPPSPGFSLDLGAGAGK